MGMAVICRLMRHTCPRVEWHSLRSTAALRKTIALILLRPLLQSPHTIVRFGLLSGEALNDKGHAQTLTCYCNALVIYCYGTDARASLEYPLSAEFLPSAVTT